MRDEEKRKKELISDLAALRRRVSELERAEAERNRAELKLQDLLEREQTLRWQLEEESERRADFLRVLVHELKTPLTPILSSSELLVDMVKGQNDERWLRLARNIHQGAYHLNNRIAELFDLARGEMQMLKINSVPVDLPGLLRRMADDLTPAALSQGIALALDTPSHLPMIMADEERLQQVINNLFNNALKFTSRGGVITFRAFKQEAHLVAQVEDTGSGIAPQQWEHLFDSHFRVEQDRERLIGLGLGLALCKIIVELHGGLIWAESEEGVGSTFSFSLPLPAREDSKGRVGGIQTDLRTQ